MGTNQPRVTDLQLQMDLPDRDRMLKKKDVEMELLRSIYRIIGCFNQRKKCRTEAKICRSVKKN